MIVYEPKSGFAGHRKCLEYTSIWDKKVFRKAGQMRFYGGSLEFVVDAHLDGDTLRITTYPHNKRDAVAQAAEENEKNIVELLRFSQEKYPPKTAFTMEIGKELFVITREMFIRYMPDTKIQDELFLIDSESPGSDFPPMYVYPATQRDSNTEYKKVFPVLALASDVLMGSPEESTPQGEEFAYMLLNSYLNRGFDPDCPAISSVSFPTSGKTELPAYLNTERLSQLIDKSGANNLLMKDGKIVYEEKQEEKKPKKSLKDKVKDTADTFFGKVDKESLMQIIVKDAQTSEEVNFSDALQIGFENLVTLLPYENKIINVFLDIADVARKMCVFEGQLHVIPLSTSEDALIQLFDNIGQSELIHLCDENSYPKNLLPGPKNIQ